MATIQIRNRIKVYFYMVYRSPGIVILNLLQELERDNKILSDILISRHPCGISQTCFLCVSEKSEDGIAQQTEQLSVCRSYFLEYFHKG